MIQIASITHALEEVAVEPFKDHLHNCVVEAAQIPKSEGEHSLNETASTTRKFLEFSTVRDS